jgi:hypothetical protein
MDEKTQKELETLYKIIKRDRQNIPSDILTANISQPDSIYTVEMTPKYLYIFQVEKLLTGYKRKKLFQAVNKPFRSILFIACCQSSVIIKAKLHKAIFLSCKNMQVSLREKPFGSCDFIRCSEIIVDCFRQPPSFNADVCELFKIFQRRKRGLYCMTACKNMVLKLVDKDKNLKSTNFEGSRIVRVAARDIETIAI